MYLHQRGPRPPWRDVERSQDKRGGSLSVWLTESPHPETKPDLHPEPENTEGFKGAVPHSISTFIFSRLLQMDISLVSDPCCLLSRHSDDPTDSFHHLSLGDDHQILYRSGLKQVTEHREAAAVTGFLSLIAYFTAH